MKRLKLIMILILIFLFIDVSSQPMEKDSVMFYIVNRDWHTGILLEMSDEIKKVIPSVADFTEMEFIEIGWGDEEFYQNTTNFDLFLGAKAILVPTPSVLRVQGFHADFNSILYGCNYCIKIKLSIEDFNKICEGIENEFFKNENNSTELTSERYGGSIKFFKAVSSYHLLRTCNTWIAEIMESSGMDITVFGIVTAEQLFENLSQQGEVIVNPPD